MGQVYRARDTKLNRNVALKILPGAFAADVTRLARFHREAHLLASLNHPNIAHIYGFEDSGSTHARTGTGRRSDAGRPYRQGAASDRQGAVDRETDRRRPRSGA
jgi:serine/threonine protein kinase